MVMNRKLNMDATLEDANILFSTFDNGGQPVTIQGLIRALLPQDFDGAGPFLPRPLLH